MTQTFQLEADADRVRADKWISLKLIDFSRTRIQQSFKEGLVKVNGKVVTKSAKLEGGDVVQIDLPEITPLDLTPWETPLQILFEDEHLLALDKASGLVVHPGAGTTNQTLVHALLHHCQGQLSRIGGVERPGIVHRLDRETSGVMVVAKTDEAHKVLTKAFSGRTLKKEYLALVSGVPDRLSGTIEKPIGRHPRHRHKMTVREDGKPARTDWELLGREKGPLALLRCQIHTGRTHQIRVHLADMGFPILGDEVYGYRANRVNLIQPPGRTLLHAYHLKLKHPISNETLDLIAKPSGDFRAFFPGWHTAIT